MKTENYGPCHCIFGRRNRGFLVSTVFSPPACCAAVNKLDRNFKDNSINFLAPDLDRAAIRRGKNVPAGRIALSLLAAGHNGGVEFLAGVTFKDRLRVAGLLAAGAGLALQ